MASAMRRIKPDYCPPRPDEAPRTVPPKPRGRPKARLSSLDEIAEYLHVSRTTIYRLIDTKQLPHLRIGYVLRFDLPEVLAWARKFTASGDTLSWQDDCPPMNRAR